MSAYVEATYLNKESHGIFLFPSVYINLCLPVHEKHKHFLVWDHVVSAHGSAHGSATALNRESLGVFLFLFVYINFMSSC